MQRTGGTFTLTNDVNFGASFGLLVAYVKSRLTNPSTAGLIRLAVADTIGWRNNANNGNLLLGVSPSNELTYNGVPLALAPGGAIAVADGGTGLTSYTIGDMIYATATTTLAKLGIGAANTVLRSTGTAPAWGLLVNANLDAAAAIARSKLAAGTNYRILANSSAGVMSENAALTSGRVVIVDANGQLADEAQLDKTRGGTGISSTATFPSSGVVVTEAATETLTNKTLTTPILTTPFSNGMKRASVVPGVSNYSVTATDILVAATAGTTTIVTLPAATGNTGQVYKVKKTDSSFTSISVTDGTFSTTLHTQGESVELQSNGTTYIIVNRYIPSITTTFTPVIVGFGTTIENAFTWKRIGDSVYMSGSCQAGTVNSSTWSLAFPTGVGVGSTFRALTVGRWERDNNGSNALKGGPVIFFDGDGGVKMGVDDYTTATSPFTALNGNGIFGSNQNFDFFAQVRISGWNG